MSWNLRVTVSAHTLTCFAVFVLSTICLVAPPVEAQQQAPRPIAVATFKLQSPLPKPPDMMTVFKVLPPEVSEDEVGRWMEAVGLEGKIAKRERQLIVTRERSSLEIFTQPGTGYVRFSDNANLAAERTADDLPGEDEAVAKAKDLFKKFDLLPSNASFDGVGYYEFRRADSKGTVVEEGKSGISVGFTFELNGLPVLGPGAKASVTFGAYGKIIGAARIWRKVGAGDQVTIISPEVAFERFRDGWPPEQADSEPTIRTTITVTKVEMAYYAGPGLLPQEWLEPVYAFHGYYEVEGKIGKNTVREKELFQVLIPAVPNGETRRQSTWGPQRIEQGERS